MKGVSKHGWQRAEVALPVASNSTVANFSISAQNSVWCHTRCQPPVGPTSHVRPWMRHEEDAAAVSGPVTRVHQRQFCVSLTLPRLSANPNLQRQQSLRKESGAQWWGLDSLKVEAALRHPSQGLGPDLGAKHGDIVHTHGAHSRYLFLT